jgi:hypothetical protein
MSQAGHVTLEGVLSYISPSADSMAAAYKANLLHRLALHVLHALPVLLLSQAGHVTSGTAFTVYDDAVLHVLPVLELYCFYRLAT